MFRSAVALAIVVLAAVTASAQFGVARLTLDGFGPVRIGMTEADAREAISDGKSALVLETDGKRVTSMRAGAEPAVEYIERCL